MPSAWGHLFPDVQTECERRSLQIFDAAFLMARAAAFKHKQGDPISLCDLILVTSGVPGASVQEGVLPSTLIFLGSVPRASVRGQVDPALFYSPVHQAPLRLPVSACEPLENHHKAEPLPRTTPLWASVQCWPVSWNWEEGAVAMCGFCFLSLGGKWIPLMESRLPSLKPVHLKFCIQNSSGHDPGSVFKMHKNTGFRLDFKRP